MKKYTLIFSFLLIFILHSDCRKKHSSKFSKAREEEDKGEVDLFASNCVSDENLNRKGFFVLKRKYGVEKPLESPNGKTVANHKESKEDPNIFANGEFTRKRNKDGDIDESPEKDRFYNLEDESMKAITKEKKESLERIMLASVEQNKEAKMNADCRNTYGDSYSLFKFTDHKKDEKNDDSNELIKYDCCAGASKAPLESKNKKVLKSDLEGEKLDLAHEAFAMGVGKKRRIKKIRKAKKLRKNKRF